MCSGCLRSDQDAIQIRFQIAEGNVARDRVVKHVVLLKHHSDVPADIPIIQRS
jgi:hypothetical protein